MNRFPTVFAITALAVAGFGTRAAAAAETILHGQGRYTASQTPLTLASGEQLVLMTNYAIASMASPNSASAPELVQFRCGAMGILSKENKFNFDVYCTMNANDHDAIDLKGSGDSDLVKVTVVGGKGRWAGATGSGTITPQNGNSSRAFSYELKIETP